MKPKMKKLFTIIVSIVMIIIILGDLVYPIRLLILGLMQEKKYSDPESFTEDYQSIFSLANLVLKTTVEDNLPDYGIFIAKYLKSIGIDVEIKVEARSTFYAQLNYTHDYDLFLLSLNSSDVEEQMFWKVGNYYNPSNLNSTIPYVKDAEELLNNATNEADIDKKREYLFELQELVMDKILFLFPLFFSMNEQFNQTVLLGFNLERPFVGAEDNSNYMTSSGKTTYTVGVAVRKAICYTIDREEMNQEINNGKYEIINTIVTPYQSFWINEEVTTYERDAIAAFSWLEASGYSLHLYDDFGVFNQPFFVLALTSPIYIPVLIVSSVILYFSTRIWKKLSKEITKTKEIAKDGTY